MPIKNIVALFDKINEPIQPDMVGANFTLEEKKFLIEIARLQNKWLAGKKYLKDNHALEVIKSQKRVESVYQLKQLQSTEVDVFPSPKTIVSTLCRKGKQEAEKIFVDRMSEIQEWKKTTPTILFDNQELQNKMVYKFDLDYRS